MNTHITLVTFNHSDNFPVIDIEFDRFEVLNDLEAHLREAKNEIFYHDTFAAA